MIELKPQYLEELRTILQRHVPDASVWAFGSRVGAAPENITAEPGSDLDLVIRFPDQTGLTLGRLREALRESNIPILVDVLDWERIPEGFRDEIRRNHEVIQ